VRVLARPESLSKIRGGYTKLLNGIAIVIFTHADRKWEDQLSVRTIGGTWFATTSFQLTKIFSRTTGASIGKRFDSRFHEHEPQGVSDTFIPKSVQIKWNKSDALGKV
jgi:hypothetical protein